MCGVGAQTWQGRLQGLEEMVRSLSGLTGVCAIPTACLLNEKDDSDHRLKHLPGQEIRAGKADPEEGVLAGPAAVLVDLNQLMYGSERETQKHPPQFSTKPKIAALYIYTSSLDLACNISLWSS